MAAPIEDKTFSSQELMLMHESIVDILTINSVNMIINYQLDSDKDKRAIQPSLINKLNFS
ncbi:hypothetical protein [Companilactobacillus kimchiensis]|uniref:Uncharacterized protein n=1 Tax=Companilactobacillus kimchiensis TaxID=993692 RepID=A0A0R2LEC4_9LACO|nr:hypothetical protein [Companilactobacillus kimchiensis]KRN97692.1 hypothetical protein IV57_GL001616 [Companilactobacillus kimchiensis]